MIQVTSIPVYRDTELACSGCNLHYPGIPGYTTPTLPLTSGIPEYSQPT